MSLLAERLWMADEIDLAEAHARLLGAPPGPGEGRVLVASRIKHTIERAYSPEGQRFRAARRVALIIMARWSDAGIKRWRRDDAGLPVPLEGPAGAHRWYFAYRCTPSGKALFGCMNCTARLVPATGGEAPCPGLGLSKEAFDLGRLLALAVHGGALYEADELGVPRPTAPAAEASACLCCWCVGPWTEVDRLARQRVCPACARDALDLTRLGGPREVPAAVQGRSPLETA